MSRNKLMRAAARLKNSVVGMLFIGTQIAFPLAAAGVFVSQASATPVCIIDTGGANDVPGQKDLTKLCADYSGVPTTLATTWNWDETGTHGSNSLDGCNLFDSNGNGNADYAVCVTTTGDPAVLQTTTTYSCGDAADNRCTTPITVISSGTTVCDVTQQSTDPFPTGASSPIDTQGACNIQLSTVGGSATTLVDVCSYPSAQPNSSPSDCVIAKPKSGKVEVVKQLVPTTDSGLFNLQIDAVTKASNVSNNGSTGEVVLPEGNHSVGETAGTSTSLATYDSAIECRDLNGIGTVVASGTGTSLSGIPVADASDIVCVITNTVKQATLILNKTVINDNGGTLGQSSFPVAIGSTTAQWGSNTVLPGSYTVSETTQAGYQASNWGGDCTTTGSVTLTAGQTKTCSITNDDIAPQLTVIKHVVNDNGGTATASNFTINVTGTNVSTASFNGAESPGTTVTLDAGTYSADETAYSGYAKTLGADCSGSIALGETKTCTITNDDIAPTLTMVKNVTNDNGGTAVPTDWTLSATPTTGSVLSGSGGFADQTAQAGVSYALAESVGPSGYVAGNWSCDGGTLVGSDLTLPLAGDVTCQITNNDIAPVLTVTKVVTNDDGGTLVVSNFPLYVGAVQVTSGTSYNSFDAGTYTVSETQQLGYTLTSITGDCLSNGSITLAVGGVYTCTLTNNDQPATITVTKIINNTHGGTASATDFQLFVGTTQVSNGVSNNFAANQQYTIRETALVDGYQQASLSCVNTDTEAQLGATFTPTLDEHIACTITNDDIAPQLKVVKVVINNNGGTAVISDFPLFVDQTVVTSGQTNNFDAGSYTVSETNQTGYSASFSGDCNAQGVVTLAVGDSLKTCTITNDDIAPTITVIKHIVSGQTDSGLFNLRIDGSIAGTGSNVGNNGTTGAVIVTAGHHVISETAGFLTDLSDYVTSFSGACASDGSLDVALAENARCTITNTRRGSITIIKDAQPNASQVFTFTGNLTGAETPNFTLVDDGSASGANQRLFSQLDPTATNNNYTVTEPSVKGWGLTAINCLGGSDVSINQRNVLIHLQPGENVTCTFVNRAVSPKLTVIKHVVNVLGNNQQASDFTMNVAGSDVSESSFPGDENGTTVTLGVGAYTVTEASLPTGYAATYSDGCTGSLDLGDEASCTVTNTAKAPVLLLTKTNNRPNPTIVGDTVTYTLVVTVPADSGVVFDTKVTDLPPENFTYITGSWTANSSIRGDLKLLGLVTEPTYGSPGDWLLGTLSPGEVITLTYKTIIGAIVTHGTYPDVAFVKGLNTPESGTTILGNMSIALTPFVSTQVALIPPPITPRVYTAGQVEVLVNTGTKILTAQYGLPIALIGAVYLFRRTSHRQEVKGGKI